jgi:hypothetical protein
MKYYVSFRLGRIVNILGERLYTDLVGEGSAHPSNQVGWLGMTLLNAFAPARLHMATSSFILITSIFEVETSFRNTRAFLSFQISQEINIASDAMAFFDCPCLTVAEQGSKQTPGQKLRAKKYFKNLM